MTFWTEIRDRRLIAMQDAGLSCTTIGVKLGATRNAVIARSNRIRGVKFASDGKANERRRAATQRKRAAQREIDMAALDQMQERLKVSGKKPAIRAAFEAGAGTGVIARALGVSRQYVHKIASEPASP